MWLIEPWVANHVWLTEPFGVSLTPEPRVVDRTIANPLAFPGVSSNPTIELFENIIMKVCFIKMKKFIKK